MRTVRRIVKSIEAHEGAGFVVHRPFPAQDICQIDPFLLIDELGPTRYAPGKAISAPDHPHRGFETITYILEGGVFHEDSGGASTELLKGDVQWMTAGRGVVHSELPLESLVKNGGLFHGVQIWVNLPKKKKMIEPSYQDIRAQQIPTLRPADGVAIKLFSGNLLGKEGPAKNQLPILFTHLTLSPGKTWSTSEVPTGWTTLVYVLRGNGAISDSGQLNRTDLVQLEESSGEIEFRNQLGVEPFDVLLLSGESLREPIQRMGPFVMNTKRELEEAYNDYLAGRMGAIERNMTSMTSQKNERKQK
jgi:redox-sensitive bicupin YhaK (pirin superfamily)